MRAQEEPPTEERALYTYSAEDRQLLIERVAQFRGQTDRFLSGELSEEQFRPLRLQNGLYIQRQAPMLRIAIPYGLMSSTQLRRVAEVTRRYDRGYAHISTRQNIQLNWPALADVPDILRDLAEVDLHCIQTSGNCIRNTTTDALAGVAIDELIDPRPYCELIRQWSTLHPEFAFLPRKFKIAVCGSDRDRAAIYSHDVGIALVRNDDGEIGAKVIVGGGLGRTPIIGQEIEAFVPIAELLNYLESVLRVYNLLGRRDNKYKARIKILVKAMGVEAFRDAVHAEWSTLAGGSNLITAEQLDAVSAHFSPMPYSAVSEEAAEAALKAQTSPLFQRWLDTNTTAHQQCGYRAVTISLKTPGQAPGDITAEQMDVLADLADTFSFGELRNTHEQNIVLADVAVDSLYPLWQALQRVNLATANIGHLTDMITCPGGDFCSLANARSLPVAEAIAQRFDDLDYLYDLGPIELNISGCMNACGHHHIGHIGILGVDKKGEEFFQVSLGGSQGAPARIGQILGPSFKADKIPDVIATLLQVYLEHREDGERFIDTCHRIGIEPFKESVYGAHRSQSKSLDAAA